MRAFPVRIGLIIVLFALLTAFGVSCRGNTPASLEPKGQLQKINIFNVPSSLRPGQGHLLGATGIYSGTATYKITPYANWSSSDPLVIEIIGKGVLKAVGGGTAIITATYKGVTASVSIKVEGAPVPGSVGPTDPVIDSILVEPTFVSISEGDTVQFKATLNWNNGIQQDVTNLVDWRVSDDRPGFIIDSDNSNAWGVLFGLFKATGPVGTTTVSAEYLDVISNYATVVVKK